MKTIRKLISAILVLCMAASLLGAVSAMAADVPEIDENAIFEQVDSDRIFGGTVYAYTPSDLYNPPPMLMPVIFVFGDKPYADMGSAWKAMCDAGLLEIAESEHAAVMMINPLGEEWGDNDIDVLNALISLVGGGGCDGNYFTYRTYYTLLFAVGEGSGATFINGYVTQNAGKIAAAATFGGEMPDNVPVSVPLPAYISSGSSDAVDYFRAANRTNSVRTDGGKTEYYYSKISTQRVVVNPAGTAVFDRDVMLDAWFSVMRRTTRNTLGFPIWANKNTDEVLTLMDRPMTDELGLRFNECSDRAALPAQQRWYEWVPEEVFEEGNDEVYPLVMCYHGSGDHPIFEAESNGWVKVAADERIIVIAPENNNMAGTTSGNIDATPNTVENNLALIEYIKDKYPIDESRIYVTGFSLGGANTIGTAGAYPDVFAAAAPAGDPRINEFTFEEGQEDELDLPFFTLFGSQDMFATTGTPSRLTGHSNLQKVLDFNNIDFDVSAGEPDFDTYPFYGFETPEITSKLTKHGVRFDTMAFANDDGVEMVKMMVAQEMNHNHYTEFAPEVWRFFRCFSRDPETKAVIYNKPVEITGSTVTAKCGEAERTSVDFVFTGDAELTSVRAVLTCEEFDILNVTSDYSMEYNPANGKLVVYNLDDIRDGDTVFTVEYDLDVSPWVGDGLHEAGIEVVEATGADAEFIRVDGLAGWIDIANEYVKGDVNRDGELNNADLVMIARYLVDLVEFDAKQMEIADFNDDGAVNNKDLVLIARALVAQ